MVKYVSFHNSSFALRSLKKAQGLSDLAKLAAIVANFTFGSSFLNRLLHLEGKKLLESVK
jgi:hypothetical protein